MKQALDQDCADLEAMIDIIPYARTFLGREGPRLSWEKFHTQPDIGELYFFTHLEPYQKYRE